LPHIVVARKGTVMNPAPDPDLPPQLEYWQWHADSFQWVMGSLVAELDSIPT
jgi:hypothetical protein